MARGERQQEQEADFYETIRMPRTPGAIVRKSYRESIFNSWAERAKIEAFGFANLLMVILSIASLSFLGLNAIAFTFFGQGIRAPLQPSRVVPLDKPIKIHPR